MKKIILLMSAMIVLGITNESWADCGTEVTGDGSVGTNSAGNKCGVCGTAGHESDCRWEIKDGVLTITAADGATNVAIRNYSSKNIGTAPGYVNQWASTAPWARQSIKSVNIDERISEIGEYAFYGEDFLTTVDMQGVTVVNSSAFNQAHNLTDVNMPNVESIDKRAFAWTNLSGIDLPNIRTIGEKAFTKNPDMGLEFIGIQATYIDENGMEQDVSIASDAFSIYNSASGEYNTLQPVMSSCIIQNGYKVCGSCGDNYIMRGQGCVADCRTGYAPKNGVCTAKNSCAVSGKYWQEGTCVSSCGASFKLNDGWCDRQRYTPAEAAERLSNDNNNEVVITFRIK